MTTYTPEQKAYRVVTRMENAGSIGNGLKVDREEFLGLVESTWEDLEFTGSYAQECLKALEYLMAERDYFI